MGGVGRRIGEFRRSTCLERELDERQEILAVHLLEVESEEDLARLENLLRALWRGVGRWVGAWVGKWVGG